ncbi:cold-shock protein [Aliiroseovarius sp. S2029]|uniref:cold-shock protein n=1 Tax=Aliiroseovarius sp. S2029 TaxID=2936988 RepID=UPI0020C03B87|nr:cold-shock protein [Aliiroseovarius sp. S2029]MCK8482490.1 cold-shock protein [Aliiroseovarius sp. S2029]
MADKQSGIVKWFNTTKGYGFIAPEAGGNDVFVHISAVERSGLTGLADNQKVRYDLQEGRDGRQSAVDLELVS